MRNKSLKDSLTVKRNCFTTYGCEYEAATVLNGGLPLLEIGSPSHRYLKQRQNAGNRKIEWQFTFDEWMSVWNESGKWHLRGRGLGHFCMARNGDIGPYSKSNVFICESEENSRDGIKKCIETLISMSKARKGLPKNGTVARKAYWESMRRVAY